MDRHHWGGILFVTGSLLGALVCAVLLYYDIFVSRSSHIGLEDAAVLVVKKDSVTRKQSSNLLWERVDLNEHVYWGDAIQTAEKSGAVLYLKDGTKIKLGESSLVVLEKVNGTLSINLNGGTFSADMSQTVGDPAFLINGKPLSPSLSKTKKMSYSVDSKSGDLVSFGVGADGLTRKTTVKRSGESIEEILPVSLAFPDDMTRVFTKEEKIPVKLRWTTQSPIPTIIEIAHERNFKRPLVRKLLRSEVNFETTLARGDYYWRVRYFEKGKTLSTETRRFSIDKKGFLEGKTVVKVPVPTATAFATRAVETRSIASELPKPKVEIPPPIVKQIKQKKPRAPANVNEGSTWTVLLATFATEEEASKSVNDLRNKGLNPYYAIPKPHEKYAVTVGLFGDKAEAQSYAAELQRNIRSYLNHPARLVVVRSE